ncbi:hypothetical protein BDR07DRAFT_1414877 [Suillus spraguei]|nr:hypothetical protein BDR07DRAFT_1414877 [Suillus spraguei]
MPSAIKISERVRSLYQIREAALHMVDCRIHCLIREESNMKTRFCRTWGINKMLFRSFMCY